MFQRFDIHSRIVKRSGITFYGAKDKLLGREVWLWRLFEFGEAERPSEESIVFEKAPLRALKLPAIVRLLDIEADPDGVVALLEPAVGEPLDELMARGPVDLQDFNHISASCFEALSAASGVPHGALEPGLIFTSRSADGKMGASLVGFGIARLVTRLHGQEHECSEALDVWMLGGILHALLTGTMTEGGRVVQPPHEIRPEVPAGVSQWVMRLLVDDVSVRPQTAADALAQLRDALAPAPVDPPAGFHPPMQPAQWPAGYYPSPYQPPMWQYPQVPVWHVPPAQWTQPYDPALAAQQPQMWQQVHWYPWQGQAQMPADPCQQQFAQQQPAASPAAKPAPNSNVPKSKPIVSPKSAAASAAKPAPASTAARSKALLRRWAGPAVSLAVAAVVVWFFRDVFAPVLRRETWQGMLGDNVTIKWPGGKPPPAAPSAKAGAAEVPAAAKETATASSKSQASAKKKTSKTPPADPPVTRNKAKSPAKKSTPAKIADEESSPVSR